MGRPALSKNAFHRTMLSGCQFVALMIDADAVKECSAPFKPGEAVVRCCARLHIASLRRGAKFLNSTLGQKGLYQTLRSFCIPQDVARAGRAAAR